MLLLEKKYILSWGFPFLAISSLFMFNLFILSREISIQLFSSHFCFLVFVVYLLVLMWSMFLLAVAISLFITCWQFHSQVFQSFYDEVYDFVGYFVLFHTLYCRSYIVEVWGIIYSAFLSRQSMPWPHYRYYYSYLPNPSALAGYDTRSIFKRSLTGLNSEFSFS